MIEQTVVNRRYRVGPPIGEGGMAVVYRGHDLLLEREVAIKALRPQFARDAAFLVRFEREAQAAAGFTHPNIIDIYDVGEEDGTPYIVMAYVDGESLKEIIAAEAPFHPDDVAALLAQLCSALDYAHERGYVHRDVKPQNILVDAQGQARVVDFGIAKGLADSDLTEIGVGLGTVHYLSPEQASGLMATPASDVYSAGVVAFEMLTGRLPFGADSPVGVAMRHVHDPPPPPSAFARAVPPEVDALVLRALAKDPTRRFPTAGAFAAAMGRWRRHAPSDRDPIATAASSIGAGGADDGDGAGDPRHASPAVSPHAPDRRLRSGGIGTPPSQSPGSPSSPSATARDEIGCATWIAGSLILLGLIALIWVGVRLSEDGSLFGAGASIPTDPAGPTESASAGVGPSFDETAATDGQPTIQAGTDPQPAVVAVPQVIGLDPQAAEIAANGRGLLLAVGQAIASEAIPAGLVAEQEPRAEANAPQGETISVRLSTGPATIDLAALGLVGRPADEAEALLRERGLDVERADVGSRDVPAGAVAAVEPAGPIDPGGRVTLRLSVGDRVRIPAEIQGQPLDQVERQLTDLDLVVRDRFGVDRSLIEGFEVDLASDAIADGDVVGIQGVDGADGAVGVDFDAWVPRRTEVDLVYYDRALDRS